jgi:hypothetical protein
MTRTIRNVAAGSKRFREGGEPELASSVPESSAALADDPLSVPGDRSGRNAARWYLGGALVPCSPWWTSQRLAGMPQASAGSGMAS